jgi:dihydroorotase
MEGDFGFVDAAGGGVHGKKRLLCELTLKDGRISWNWNARGAEDFRKLGPSYGIREGTDFIVPPPRR